MDQGYGVFNLLIFKVQSVYSLKSKLQTLLPDTYEVLAQFADLLPCGEVSPAYPFTGYVLNINVTTRIHRDWGDKEICLVLPIFDSGCIGGELCLKELGLVMRMKSLDVIIFASHQLSHFNLNYIGKRASLVLHSDRGGDAWVCDRDGWENNIYTSTVFCGSSSGNTSKVGIKKVYHDIQADKEEEMDCSSD